MSYSCAGYLREFLEPKEAKLRIARAAEVLKRYKFDTIAFTGLSGALLAPELSHKLKKHLIAVRKSEGKSHSSRKVEGYIDCKKYVIVVDMVDTGKTAKRIQRAIKKFSSDSKCIGVLEVGDLDTDIDVRDAVLNTDHLLGEK